jgi:large repetitive protein
MKRFFLFSAALVLLTFAGLSALAAAIPLSLGQTYAGTLAVPGETHTYTFTGAPGQRLYVDAQDADGLQMDLALLSPGGTTLYQRNDDYDSGPLVVTEPGVFTLLVNGNGATTGAYQFRLLDLSQATPLVLGSALSDQLNPGLACNVYGFNGTRGQRISLQSLASSSSQAQWQLLSPANMVLSSGQIYQNLGTVTLPATGPYCLLVSGASVAVTPLAFRVLLQDVSDSSVVASGFGVSHSGTVNANQTNSFTYTAPAGLPVYFDSLDRSGQSLVVDLVDPFGNAVFSVGEIADSGPYVLPRSGNYTLNVRGPGGASGNFNFRLLDGSAGPVLAVNTAVTNSLAAPYQTDIYQLNGTAGQRLFYDSWANAFASVQVQLIGPDGQSPINNNVSYDLGPITLAYSGAYYFCVQSALPTPSSYLFQLLDLGTQPPVPLNADFTGALAPYTSLAYSLAGTKGQQLYFNGKAPVVGGAYWTLYDPKNAQLGSANVGADFSLILPYAGNYSLILTAPGTAVVYSNQVSTFGFITNALALGSLVSNNIVHPGDQLVYTFAGNAGQRLFFDSLLPTYLSLNVTLISPKGLTVFSGNASTDFGPMTLPQTGAYTFIFSGFNHTTGGVSFQLLDIGTQPALPFNTDISGSVPPYASTIYQFTGTNGELLYFNGKLPPVAGAYWTLFDPKNSVVAGANLGADFGTTLQYAGTYALVLQAAGNPGDYSNQVNTVSFATNQLTLNAPTPTTIQHPGDQTVFNFPGTAGQRLYFDSLNAAYLPSLVVLVSPSGLTVFSSNPSSDFGPCTLTESGTYSLFLSGSGDTTGSLSFQLLEIASQPALPLNLDLSGTLPANTSLMYQITGTAGQQLFFNAKGVSTGGAYWTLYDPKNSVSSGSALGGDFVMTLPYSGTYALVAAAGANTVSYTNQVNTFSFTTNPLTLGARVTTAIVHPGDQAVYTFTGTTGQRLYYDSRQTNASSCLVSLASPTGGNIFSISSGSDYGPLTLPQTGTYSLALSGSGDTTATLSFQLLDLGAASLVNLGTTITDSLSDQTETRLYRFNGTQGQRVKLSSLSGGGNSAIWTLWNLTDRSLGFIPYINTDIGTVTLPATGTYVFGVIGYATGASPVNYQLSLTDVSDVGVSPSGFGVLASGTIGSGQTNSFPYAAPAGLPVFFDSQDLSGQSLVVDLIGPDGIAVFTVNETSDAGPYTLPRSGAYTLSVRSYNGTASGNYSFRLLDLSASPNLPLNTALSSGLTGPYQTDFYQFTNAAGRHFIYDALTNDANFPSVSVQLLDPNGQIVGVNGNFSNDRGPFPIQYAGTSYLVVRNNRAVTSPYSFQLLDVASQPVAPLNVSLTNTLNLYPLQVYRFSGTAGQRLYFSGLPTNPIGYWTLFDPNDNGVSGSGVNLAGDFETTLPYSGNYTLTLAVTSGGPGTEVFQVSDYSYLTNSYSIGSAVTGALNRPGERRVYTFTGTVGQQLIYDALTNDPAYPNVITAQLLNPEGIPEGPIGGRFSFDRTPFTLQQSGVYSLVFDGNGATVGPFAFQLLDVAALAPLPINVAVTNLLDTYAAVTYRIAGTNGQRLFFHGQPTNPNGAWGLYGPNNSVVSSAGLGGDFEATLPLAGTYALIIYNYATTAPIAFQVNDYAWFTNSYTLGTSVLDGINRPGERRVYTFNGTVSQQLIYDALTNDPPYPNVIFSQLFNPQGQPEGPFGLRFTSDRGPFTLQQSGPYSLVLDGNVSGVGPVAFRLLDVATQPLLPLSTPVTNTLDVFSLIVYRYSGVAGDHLYFRGQPSNPSGSWTLYDPNNYAVSGAGLTGDFEVTLPLTGTYALVLASYGTAPGPVIFTANPFNFGGPVQVNRAPNLVHIPDQLTGEGTLISFTAQATDPDNNSLAFSLDPGAPPGAAINAVSGLFTWTPPGTGFSYVTNVTVRVTDDGVPSMNAAQALAIAVVAAPIMMTVKKAGSTAVVYWRSALGKHYQLQFKHDLSETNWTNIGGVIAATDFITSESDQTLGADQERYYRVNLLDPY